MELNSDFIRRAVMHGARLDWVASPIAGIDRRMLDRVGAEVARATTIVRYAPDSQFSAHVHTGGEEILVLDGVFQDEHGDFPAGSYIRNPPQSRHTPGSRPGCTIFTKLWQFDPADRTHVRIDTAKMPYVRPADRSDVELLPLFCDQREDVRLERWPAASRVRLALPGGGEFLVLDGRFEEAGDTFEPQSWLRLPPSGQLEAMAGPRGCTVWVPSRRSPLTVRLTTCAEKLISASVPSAGEKRMVYPPDQSPAPMPRSELECPDPALSRSKAEHGLN